MKYKNLQTHLSNILTSIKEEGLFKVERVITSPQSSKISTNNYSSLLNFCSNNYLGLCNNKNIVDSAIEAIRTKGFGTGSPRFASGTNNIHKLLESEISEFYEKEDTILFTSCFDANETIFETLLTDKDAIVSDRLNHASIINGIRLSKAQRFLYETGNMQDLENKLMDSKNSRYTLVVTDGVFSMDGEIAKISQICDLAEKYDCSVMVDECHGTGVVGAKGRGAIELTNSLNRIDVVSSTLGKALGGATGGFISGKKEIIEYIRQNSQSYLNSNNLPTHEVQTYRVALRILVENPNLIQKLNKNVKIFRNRMQKLGFNLMGDENTAICPVLLKDARLTAEFAEAMLNEGIYVIGFSFPVVPKGLARIRVQISAAHSEQDVDACVDAFEKIGKLKGVI